MPPLKYMNGFFLALFSNDRNSKATRNFFKCKALAKRRVAIPTETIQRATDLQIKQLAEKEYERIGELQSALIGRANSGRCYLEEKRKRSTLQRRREARKKIEKIIDEGPINHQMPIEDVRWRIEVNPSTSVYFNESQELYKPNSNLVFKHTSTNKSTMEGSYRMQLRVNAEIEQEEELTCHCVDVCGDLCPCSGLRKIIREGPLTAENDAEKRSLKSTIVAINKLIFQLQMSWQMCNLVSRTSKRRH
nr:hypothetical protein W01C8.4 - Caenorhabditis elegans [Caenorhabditis elegans]